MFTMTLMPLRMMKSAGMTKENKVQFTGTTHRAFRQHIKRMGSLKMKTRGVDTLLFDAKGQIIGKMAAASMDEKGRITPVKYFVALPKTAKSNEAKKRATRLSLAAA